MFNANVNAQKTMVDFKGPTWKAKGCSALIRTINLGLSFRKYCFKSANKY